jgi:hypothetical protein
MKKNRQSSSNSETTNKMNIENDFIRNENFKKSASHAYVNLAVKTRILLIKKLVFAIQTKAFHARFDSRSFEIRNNTKNSKKRFVSLSKKQKILFRKKRLKKSF